MESLFAVGVPLVRSVDRPQFDEFLAAGSHRPESVHEQISGLRRGRFGIPRIQSPLDDRRWSRHDRFAHDLFGGGDLSFHEERRQGKHIADIVKAVADVIGEKILGRIEVNAHQIADGVAILDAIEPPHGDSAWDRLRVLIVVIENGLDQIGEGNRFGNGRFLSG